MTMNRSNKSGGIMDTGMMTLIMFMVSITMAFAALTSAYLVRRAEGNWLEFDIPQLFIWSTIIIVLSSGTAHLSYKKMQTGESGVSKMALFSTVLLGFGFLTTQVMAWSQMIDQGIYFGGSDSNAAGSFMYVLTWLHWMHIISGIIYLGIIFGKTLFGKVTQSNVNVLKTCATYWHFLGLVWIGLYVFLVVNH